MATATNGRISYMVQYRPAMKAKAYWLSRGARLWSIGSIVED